MASADGPSALLVGLADPYMVRACRKHGITPVVFHGPDMADWGYVRLADDVQTLFAEDPKDAECLLAAIHRAGLENREFLCVQSTDEFAQVSAGVLAQHLGASGVDTHTAVRFRDKWLQKRYVREAGLNTAGSEVIDDIFAPGALARFEADGIGKSVLKPVAGAGTMNTVAVNDLEDLRSRIAQFRRDGVHQRTFVLEEFVDGEEWVADGVVFEGRIQFFGLGAYAKPCLDVVSANKALQMERFDPVADQDLYEAAEPVVSGVISALRLERGVFHMELFRQAETGKIYFSEVAARRGGGLTQEEIDYKFGVDLAEAALLCAAGRDPRVKPRVRPEAVGMTYLLNRGGTLISCPSLPEIQARPGVRYARLELPLGFQIPENLTNTIGKVGQAVVGGATREELAARRDDLAKWFDDNLAVAPAGATIRELRDWQAATWPDRDSRFQTFAPTI
jgi:biotin carboxylase